MCGRFTLTVSIEELIDLFGIEQLTFEYHPRYNAAPGQMIATVIGHQGNKRMGQLRWGLIPSWSKDEKIGYQLINAKAETLEEKPSFRESYLRRRCVIPADGFYEWKNTENGKQPMRIMMKHKGAFAMAGLYDAWMSPDGRKIHSCAIITTSANALVGEIHDRMPVILRAGDIELWLNREIREASRLNGLLQPYPENEMFAYPVSPAVGNVKNDSPECIMPFGT